MDERVLGPYNAKLKRLSSSKDNFEDDRMELTRVKSDFVQEARGTAGLALPLCISGTCKMAQALVLSVMLGRKHTMLLAAVSVSTIWTSWSDALLMGGHVAMGALCGQAYGAGNFALVGTWLQIALVNITILFPPLILMRFYTGEILLWLGVDHQVSILAGLFTAWSSLAFIFELWYGPVRHYFAAQSIILPDMVIDVVYLGVTSLLIWWLVYHEDMGIFGVAVALSIKRLLRVVSFVGYCWWMGYQKKTWKGWNWGEILVKDRWKIFLSQTIPAMIFGVGEQIQFQAGALMAANIGVKAVAAFDLLTTTSLLLYSFVWSWSTAAGIRMAVALGEGKVQEARKTLVVGFFLCNGTLVLLNGSLYLLSEPFSRFVSNDPMVQEQIQRCHMQYFINMMIVGNSILASEALTKSGRAVMNSVTMLCNWFIGVPSMYFLHRTEGLHGILTGQMCGYGSGLLITGMAVMLTDWEAVGKQCRANSEVKRD